MHYLIYKTTNLINDKIYIGCHKTDTVEDDYIGSGTVLTRAINKYGRENFAREVLHDYNTPKEMFDMEAVLVNEQFIKDDANYNIKLGGNGGFDYVNKAKTTEERIAHAKIGYDANKEVMTSCKKNQYAGRQSRDLKTGIHADEFVHGLSFKGKHHTQESKQQIGKANSVYQSGKGNSQFGSIWITTGTENKKIPKLSPVPTGWRKGRVCTL